MSGFDRLEAAGDQFPECAQLYRDMGILYRAFGNELLEQFDPPSGELVALVEGHEISYHFREGPKNELDADLAGANVVEPMQLTHSQEFLSLEVAFHRKAGERLDEVHVPRVLESAGTADQTEPPHPRASHLGMIVASIEDRPFLANALDIDAAVEIDAEARGAEPVPSDTITPDILAFHGVMRAAGEQLQYLNEAQCAALRVVLPQMQYDVELTIRENGLAGA